MRAVLVTAYGETPELTVVPDPTCAPDGVVVTVQATGLCRSDWHGWMGHDDDIELPHVPGHELAGRIVEVGTDVTRWRIGDRVTTPFVLACGACASCLRGNGQVCEDQLQPGFTHWGSYAELVSLPRADLNLVALPDEMSGEVAASLGCRFGTAYRAVVDVARLEPGESIAVFGCGGVGLSAVMIAVALGGRVVAVDPDPASLSVAADLGATTVLLDSTDGDGSATVRELTGGGSDVTIDAFGSASALATAIDSLRPRGRHVQVGLLAGDDARPRVDMTRVIGHELQVLGSHGIAAADYPAMLARVVDGSLDPARLIRDHIGLAEAGTRLAALGEATGGVGGMTIIRP
ncbi:MAG: zinc-dependent alcohol dehydrogenase family protein [Nocardioides sp.]